MKLATLPTYEEFLQKYRSFRSVGKNKYDVFCKEADRTIYIFRTKIDSNASEDELMNMVYEVYNDRHINRYEF